MKPTTFQSADLILHNNLLDVFSISMEMKLKQLNVNAEL